MSNLIRNKYDIIINGGGIVGFTFLNLLLKSPSLKRAKILLVERASKPTSIQQPPRQDETQNDSASEKSFSNRVSSITSKSKKALKELGVWDQLRPYAKDVRMIHVWNYDYNNKIEFTQDLPAACDLDLENRDVLFTTLENSRLSNILLDNIITNHGRSEIIAWSSRLEKLEESLDLGHVDAEIVCENDDTQIVSAPLIIGCDGYNSKVRDLTNLPYREIDLKKTALVGTVKMSHQLLNNHNDIAYQRFSSEKDTVAALLPLDHEYSSFVISAPTDYANHLKDCDEETFIQEFNNLLSTEEVAKNPLLRGVHELSNTAYDNTKALLQLVKPRLGISDSFVDFGAGSDGKPSVDRVVKDSRATFPLIFGTTSPRMVAALPGLDRTQVALLGDASHRVHPLAGQGLNLGIQDAVELSKQLETIASSGERIFHESGIPLLSQALRKYELKRQAYIVPMSTSILVMQDVFKLAPSRLVSSFNKCYPMKTMTTRFANGC